MNAVVQNLDVPTVPGTPFAGGFYAGLITFGGDVYASIVAPKTLGEHEPVVWNSSLKNVEGALSFFDGLMNTRAMAEAGSELAKWALGLQIAGESDWYLPSRDELELLYRHFKPTSDDNWVFRNGDNPSSLPVGYPYTAYLPGRTDVALFREDGAEAFAPEWYWSSSQYAGHSVSAWIQYFGGGSQSHLRKTSEFRARAVRRLKIS